MELKENKKELEGIRLISEREIQSREEDEFHHQYYVDVLKDIVKNAPTPFCIGLFGKWGTGKTGIARILKEEIKNDPDSKYEVVYFDVWKHADDTLRRQLLIEIDEKILREKKKYKNFKDSLYSTHHFQDVTKHEINWEKFGRIFVLLSLVLFAALMSKVIIFKTAFDPYEYIVHLVLPAIFALLASLERLTKTTTVTKSVEKPTSPEQFEDLFKNKVMKDLRGIHKKLLIIFDNLDRCDSETVIKTLRGINTFLGEKDCVYIIPCDPEAIRKHLKNQLYPKEDKTADPDEFIRKVFQTSIEIHPLIYSDIKSYAEILIDQTSLQNHPKRREIIHVITQGFVDSPRRIKQILNNLTVKHYVARMFEIKKKIAPNVITENIDFLAKLMVLKEQWPDFHEEIQKDATVYKTSIEAIENRTFFTLPEGSKEAISISTKNKELKRFLQATKTIQNENIELFIRFNQDPLDVTIPESKKIKDSLIYRRVNELTDIFEDAKKDAQKIENYLEIVKMTMREEQAKERFINIFDSTMTILDYVPKEITTSFSEEVCSYLDQDHLIDCVHSLDLKCFDLFIKVESNNRNLQSILREFTRKLPESEIFPSEKLQVLFTNNKIITGDAAHNVGVFFEDKFDDFKKEIVDFLSKEDIKQVAPKFLTLKFMEDKLQGSIVSKRSPVNQELIDLYLNLNSIMPIKSKNKHLVSKMVEMLKGETANTYDEPKRFAIENLDKVRFEIPKDLIDPLLDVLHSIQTLIEPTQPQPKAFKIVSGLYVALYPVSNNSRQKQIKSKLTHLIGHEPESYNEILRELKESKKVRDYADLIAFMTKIYLKTGEYEKKAVDEKDKIQDMLYEEYYGSNINYFCNHIVFPLMRESESPLFNVGLIYVNRYAEKIVKRGLEKETIDILIEEIDRFNDEPEDFETINSFLDSILLFSEKCNDRDFTDRKITKLTLNFLKSAGVARKRLIKTNFNRIKHILTDDAVKTIVNNIAQYLSEEIRAISYGDVAFDVILENQDIVDEGTLLSLKTKLRSLVVDDDLLQKVKSFYITKLKVLDNKDIKECLADFIGVAKDDKLSRKIRDQALDAIRELEPRVNKNWKEWKAFEKFTSSDSNKKE